RSDPTTPTRRRDGDRGAEVASAQDAGVADRVAAGLGPDAQAVRAVADARAVQQPARARADRVDLRVVAPAQPQHAAVGGHAAHVGRAAAGDSPLADRTAGPERDDGDRALATVGDEQPARIARRVEAVGALAGRLEADLAQRPRVDQPDTVARHV